MAITFVRGGLVAMFTLTKALEFLLGVGGPNLNPMLTGDKYVSLIAMAVPMYVFYEGSILLGRVLKR